MRATGIVRRIDDLGRVVIPKEIRRTLRIREGDPMDIYTDSGGEVIFKKYSPMGEMWGFAEQFADVINRVTKSPVLITDRDHVVAVSGVSKREFMDRKVTPELEDLMEHRKSFTAQRNSPELYPVENLERSAGVAYPILSSGDITGSIVMLSANRGELPDESDTKVIQTAAAFLGKQNEE